VLLSSETKLTNSPYKAEVKLISGQKKPKITEKDHAFNREVFLYVWFILDNKDTSINTYLFCSKQICFKIALLFFSELELNIDFKYLRGNHVRNVISI